MQFVTAYSFGKDSALALHRMVQAGHTPVALLTTLNEAEGRSWVHGVEPALMGAVADSLGLPLLACPCTMGGYAGALEEGLDRARAMGAEACVFGDIDIAEHREWNEARCTAAGLDCLLPLWGEDRLALVHEGIDAGYKAAIKLVQAGLLDDRLLGHTLTRAMVAEIAATGADPCGENGEYHTLVYDGPMFRRPVPLRNAGVVDLGSHRAADLRLGVDG